VEERPTEALLKLADERDARAIVVGTFGEHSVRGAILGSVPHRLLHVSDRPVLVVPVTD
jgi:nucleotide-binding universal stress UspA family protein